MEHSGRSGAVNLRHGAPCRAAGLSRERLGALAGVRLEPVRAARLLLDTLMAGAPASWRIELRAKRASGGMDRQFFAVGDASAAAARAVELGQACDVYAGVLPRARLVVHPVSVVGHAARTLPLYVQENGRAVRL